MSANVQTTPSSDTNSAIVEIYVKQGDFVIPIVYPDFLITIPPKIIQYQKSIGIDFFEEKERYGHAGILIIHGKTGISKYYEYGRYDPEGKGIVRKVKIPDAKVKNGRIEESSLVKIMQALSKKAGKNGRIEAVMFIGNYYDKAYKWLNDPKGKYRKPDREEYDPLNSNCMSFPLDLLNDLGIKTHWTGLATIPRQEIEELQEDYKDLRYTPGSSKLEIEE